MAEDASGIEGRVEWELRGPDGELKGKGVSFNLVTDVGDTMYAQRGAGIASPLAAPTGIQIGTGSTAVAKNGAGAATVTYLIGQGFDATYPTAPAASGGGGCTVTYRTTFAAGVGTTASAVTEAVITNGTVTTTSAAANTIARVILSGIASKGSADTLTITWTHRLLGA